MVLKLKQKYVIASEKIWNENIHTSLNKNVDCEFILLSNRRDLNIDNLRIINPKIIFFPHWSYLIPEEIYTEFECIVFHMTDLPYGRGGSPLQNLIMNGFSDTKITAISVVILAESFSCLVFRYFIFNLLFIYSVLRLV